MSALHIETAQEIETAKPVPVKGNFWRGVLFALPISLALWACIFAAVMGVVL